MTGRPVSAARVLSSWQRMVLALFALAVAAGLATAAGSTALVLLLLSIVFCTATSGHQLAVCLAGLRSSPREDATAPGSRPGERQLPSYTILVPLYREASVVRSLLAALEGLDYPRDKLDVKLLVEADDRETIDELESVELASHFEVVTVPVGEPRTKPKACNLGLARARGDLVVVFDAEDRPESDQLRRAALAFLVAPADIGCLQARLGFWNARQNLLTRLFTTEYCKIFDLHRRGLARAGAPVPLGGTSNHLPVRVVRELGAWDPFNVTEDADLGIRLARAGYRTALLDSTTYEEATSRLANWIRQRSRWSKGYLQTWLVHVRRPVAMSRELGLRGSLHFHLTILGSVAPLLLNPIYWTIALLWLLAALGLVEPPLSTGALAAVTIWFALRNAAHVWVHMAGLPQRGYRDLRRDALLAPAYWALCSIAAWKGVGQLITRPTYWEKTVHGLAGREPAIVGATSRPDRSHSGRA